MTPTRDAEQTYAALSDKLGVCPGMRQRMARRSRYIITNKRKPCAVPSFRKPHDIIPIAVA